MYYFFCFNDTATTEIYTLSLHDALPISQTPQLRERDLDGRSRGRPRRHELRRHRAAAQQRRVQADQEERRSLRRREGPDRKSTRLNSSHANISYAVFCLKKKKRHNK